jgi:hypothetical protein
MNSVINRVVGVAPMIGRRVIPVSGGKVARGVCFGVADTASQIADDRLRQQHRYDGATRQRSRAILRHGIAIKHECRARFHFERIPQLLRIFLSLKIEAFLGFGVDAFAAALRRRSQAMPRTRGIRPVAADSFLQA